MDIATAGIKRHLDRTFITLGVIGAIFFWTAEAFLHSSVSDAVLNDLPVVHLGGL